MDTQPVQENDGQVLSSVASAELKHSLTGFINQLSDVTAYLTHEVINKAPEAFNLICKAMQLQAFVNVIQSLVLILVSLLCFYYTKNSKDREYEILKGIVGVSGFFIIVFAIGLLLHSSTLITLISPQSELALIALHKAGVDF